MPDTTPETSQTYIPCPECGTPTEANQRYCVNCGARRVNVDDPAANYFAEASAARARVAAATAARGTGGRRGVSNLLVAVLIAVVGLGVGVLIGHGSSGNDNAKVLRALSRLDASKVVVTTGSGGGASSGSGASNSTGTKSTSGTSTTTSSAKSTSTGASTTATGSNYTKGEKNDGSVVAEP